MSDTGGRRRGRGGGAARRAERTAVVIETAKYIERNIPLFNILNEEALEIIEINKVIKDNGMHLLSTLSEVKGAPYSSLIKPLRKKFEEKKRYCNSKIHNDLLQCKNRRWSKTCKIQIMGDPCKSKQVGNLGFCTSTLKSFILPIRPA